MQKKIPLAIIEESDLLTECYVEDRLTRQATHMQGKCLASQVELFTGQPLSNWQVPAWVKLAPLGPNMLRRRLPTGEHGVYDCDKDEIYVQLPKKALATKFHVMTHVLDRSSINVSLIHFLMQHGFIMAVAWGWFHGLQNSVKNALQKACKGRPWETVMGYLLLQNLNYFPYKSGECFRQKQRQLLRRQKR